MNEAVTVKKERKEKVARALSTGVRATLKPVPQTILQDALALVKEPEVPVVWIGEKDREEENPNDPAYLKALGDVATEQARVTFDVFALFGIELEEPAEKGDWLKRLQLMERLGRLDLSRFDPEDSIDLEFLFKRYVAMGNADYILIGAISNVTEADVRQAARSFQGAEVGEPD